jgi:hypothetical protein
MSALTELLTCARCGADFAERNNIGGFGCLIHTGQRTDHAGAGQRERLMMFDCCGAQRADLLALRSPLVTGDDMLGCTSADHTAGDAIELQPLSVLPVFLVTHGIARMPHSRALLHTVTGSHIVGLADAKRAGQPVQRRLVATFPGAVGVHSLDMVNAAFAVLTDFLRSDHYGSRTYPECEAYTRAFETDVLRHALVASTWDVERNMDDFADDTAGAPYRDRRALPATRMSALARMRTRDDLALLARVMVPFYVIARVDAAPKLSAQLHYASYNRRFEALMAQKPPEPPWGLY